MNYRIFNDNKIEDEYDDELQLDYYWWLLNDIDMMMIIILLICIDVLWM